MSESTITRGPRYGRAIQAGVVLAAMGAGYALHDLRVAQGQGQSANKTVPLTTAPVVVTPATKDAAAMQGAFADVALSCEPAVVTIISQGAKPDRTASGPGMPGPFGNRQRRQGNPNGASPFGDFQDFFKQFQRDFGYNDQNFQPNSWQERVLKEKAQAKWQEIQDERGGGLGSGMIFREDGLILTNAHVVRGVDTVAVTLSDGRKFDKAKVLGRDERTDIAVVKVNATGLPTVKLGESSAVRVGDWAIAVGNPFGLDHTLTMGVISAKSRELNLASGGDSRTDYLQTDASINPGNSGGPLLDIYGRVIGINNAIYSESGGNQGIGFAIPVDTARFVADKIVREGKVRRGYLGVKISNVEDRGTAFGLEPGLKGVLVEEISDPNGPGAKAGLQPGDVITKFNGEAVEKSNQLQRLVGNSSVGSEVTLTVLRDGKTITLSAQLQELKDAAAATEAPEAPEPGGAGKLEGSNVPELGLQLQVVSPEVSRALGIKATAGIAVLGVKDGSPAEAAGLQKGDVIERVGQIPVTTVGGLQDAVKRILGRQTGDEKKVALYVNRNGQHTFVVLNIG